MLQHRKLRITWPKTKATYELVAEVLDKDCTAWASCDEGGPGTNKEPHSHYYLLTTINFDTLKSHLLQVVGSIPGVGRGNAAYSMPKEAMYLENNEEFAVKYLAYMMKERNFVASWSFPTHWVDSALELEKAQQAEYRKKKERSQFERLCDDIEKYPPKNYLGQPEINPDTICRFVVQWAKNSKKALREFQLESYAKSLCLMYVPDYENTLASRLLSRVVST